MGRDMVLLAVAFACAWWLRFSLPDVLPFQEIASEKDTTGVGLTLVLLWPWAAMATRLYVSRRTQGLLAEIWDLVRTLVCTLVCLSTLAYFSRGQAYSRATLLLWVSLSLGMMLGTRVLQRRVLGLLRARGHNLRHALVVGTGTLATEVIARVLAEPHAGLRIAGVVALDGDAHVPAAVGGVAVTGRVSSLGTQVQCHGVDQILVALPIEHMAALKTLMHALSKETVDVRIVPDVYQYMTLCGSMEDFFGLPLISLQATPLVGLGRWLKRSVDIAVALAAVVLLLPVWLSVALAIWLDDGGPVLFRQHRIGLDGQAFAMWKFRTMRQGAHAQRGGWTTAGDPRRTRLGAFLRRLSLDELPQLVNVLRGEMSLVGPRPEQPSFSEVFRHEIPRYALRHKIKAGMTGWAQIHGLRGDTSIAKRIELDLYYIEHWSLALDVKILLRTALGGFVSPHAY